jgi:hypothetical protein
MSFKHFHRVGFFGLTEEQEARRDLSAEECLALFREFCLLAPESVDCRTTTPKGNEHVQLIGICDGKHITHRRQGYLEIPYMDDSNTHSSIAFAAFVKIKLGCSVYSEADADYLTIQQLTNRPDFPTEFREFLNSL